MATRKELWNLNRLTAGFVLLACWIQAELTVEFLTLVSLKGRAIYTKLRYENVKEGAHLDG
jgi:hypothetical protein